MENSPKISVLMAVYNNSPFLREAIGSILSQTYTDFEFIIVDDGSTDNSPTILKEFGDRDPRIKILRQDNAGLTKSLNKALAQARGIYIVRMDGDDVALPDRFELQLAFMESHQDCVCSGTNVEVIDEDGELIFCSRQPLVHSLIEEQLFIGRGSAIYHPTAIIRREVIQRIGGYNEDYRIGQDLDLFLRLSDFGRLLNLEQVTLKFRKHYHSTSTFTEDSKSIERRKKIVFEAGKRKGIELDLQKINKKWGPDNKWEFHAFLMEKAVKSGNRKGAARQLRKAFKVAPFKIENLHLLHYFLNSSSLQPKGDRIQELYDRYDYLEAYSRHTDLRVHQDPQSAIGGKWEQLGLLQFDFLKKKGLKPEHTLLDFGCGTLRGGRHFIRYLDYGNYTGIDISGKAIEYAKELVNKEGLTYKSPNLLFDHNKSLNFNTFKCVTFDFILAQSVFTHLKPHHIEECFSHLRKIMHADSIFYFTFFKAHKYQAASQKDFRYPLSFFEELAEKYHFMLKDLTSDYLHPTQQNMLAVKRENANCRQVVYKLPIEGD